MINVNIRVKIGKIDSRNLLQSQISNKWQKFNTAGCPTDQQV